MPFAILVAAAAQLAAPPAAALEDSARERAIAFADALQSGAAQPHASPKITFQTYWRPRYSRTESDAAQLRAALAGCRRSDSWVYVYGSRSQYVTVRYHCPSDPQSKLWPVLEQDIDDGQVTRALLATGPRQLDRDKVLDSIRRTTADSSLPVDRAAAVAFISALRAGRTRLPNARPGLELDYRDQTGNRPFGPAAAADLRRSLAGCSPQALKAEPRRWLGSRLAFMSFSCPKTHKPDPEMAILLAMLDGRVQSFALSVGPPPPPIVARPAPR